MPRKKRPPGEDLRKKKYRCPNCNKSFKGKQNLSKHIKKWHPDQVSLAVKERVTLSMETLREMITVIDQSVGPKRSATVGVLADAMTVQEVKLRLTLATVALDKADAILRLAPLVKKIDQDLIKKLNQRCLKNMGVDDEAVLRDQISKFVSADSEFLERILSLRSPASADFFQQIVTTLRAAGQEAQRLADFTERLQDQATRIGKLSSTERERLRMAIEIIRDTPEILDGDRIKSGGASETLAVTKGASSQSD